MGGLLYVQGLCAGSYCEVSGGGSGSFVLLVHMLIFSFRVEPDSGEHRVEFSRQYKY